jgi:hypothetical protein
MRGNEVSYSKAKNTFRHSNRRFYSALHVRLHFKSHEKLFVVVMCDRAFLGVTALIVESMLILTYTLPHLVGKHWGHYREG